MFYWYRVQTDFRVSLLNAFLTITGKIYWRFSMHSVAEYACKITMIAKSLACWYVHQLCFVKTKKKYKHLVYIYFITFCMHFISRIDLYLLVNILTLPYKFSFLLSILLDQCDVKSHTLDSLRIIKECLLYKAENTTRVQVEIRCNVWKLYQL